MKKRQLELTQEGMVEDDITKFETRVNPQTGKKERFWKSDLV